MEKYINETGESTITHYEIGDDFIRVQYKNDLIEYNTSLYALQHIDKMKSLALSGKGLSRYISRNLIKTKVASSQPSIFQSLRSIVLFFK